MEKMINKVELSGFVGINPEVRTMPNGNKILRFSLATNHSYKDREGKWVSDTTWHNIVMWNKMAETACPEVKKGARISIIGRLANRSYTDKEGNKKYSTEIIAVSYKTAPIATETTAAVF
jgi:single-strand DNA-binding protein